MAAHFDFTSFSAWSFLDSWLQLFYTRGVFVRIKLTWKFKNWLFVSMCHCLNCKEESCICGYHLYQNIWSHRILVKGSYVVAVLKDDVVVSHLPRQLSWISSLLILKNGTIN